MSDMDVGAAHAGGVESAGGSAGGLSDKRWGTADRDTAVCHLRLSLSAPGYSVTICQPYADGLTARKTV